ncbi:carbohydrate ABC transporter permease [Cryptosporangium aurantiacum]|uniref:Xylobiose transport system permease protein n=1 Tax=Cryptosporangium aurantiacum TaxID=134849 RepID=A0A1M7HNT3_9ACTN|nr:sugar ABC transporter permease [Cryptosporangium aurantiacum]SHM30155.1 xylobiose transport system permease protein [Cryptosporangium aurantiacum]
MRERPGFVWAAPAAVFFALFGLVPIAVVVYLSGTSWNGLGTPQWVGTENWAALLDDSDFLPSLRTTALLTVGTWLVQTPLALLLGVWSAGAQRFRAVLSTVFFLPLLLSTAAIALVFVSLLDPNFGLAAQWGKYLGAPDGNFLGDPARALPTVIFVLAWQFVPFHTLLYQAATRQIPASLYEAAQLDGANTVRQFFAITLPQLRNTIVASSVMMLVGSVTYFESVLLLTNGGPGNETKVLPLHMYQEGFVAFDMGYASVLAVLLVIIGTVLSIVVVRATGYHRMASDREGL